MKGHTSHVKGHRIVRSVCGMLLAFSMMFFHTGYTAYADDDDVEIKKVTINIKSDITKEDSDAIEVNCSGEGFTYDGFETIIPNGNSWNASEYPRIIVTLEADEGYKFKKSSLRVNVKGDVYKVVSKKSTKDELKVTVDLEPYGGKIGAPVNPHWGGTTTASWQKGYRATSYMIVLKRDGRTVTSAETTSTSYDFMITWKVDRNIRSAWYRKTESGRVLRSHPMRQPTAIRAVSAGSGESAAGGTATRIILTRQTAGISLAGMVLPPGIISMPKVIFSRTRLPRTIM